VDPDEFKYDVGFSFLGEDEAIARRLNDILRDRVATFIYSDAQRQTQLAGRDGEELFAQVFGRECRTVTVLYRDGWGERGFTSAEATAIRNRAFEQSYDFTTFIPLDNPPISPIWLPRARLWYGLERYGIDTAAVVIESRVQEAGGTPKTETAEEIVARAQRRLRAERERDAFLESGRGAEAMRQAFWSVCDELDAVSDSSSGFIQKPERGTQQGRPIFGVKTQGFTLILALNTGFGNSTRGSELHVTLWDGDAWINYPGMGKIMRRHVFVFDLDPAGEAAWRDKESSGAGEFYRPPAMATWAVKQLTTEVMNEREREKRERR
jgi:hypothetical protein